MESGFDLSAKGRVNIMQSIEIQSAKLVFRRVEAKI